MVQTVCVRGPGRGKKGQPPSRPQKAGDIWEALQLLTLFGVWPLSRPCLPQPDSPGANGCSRSALPSALSQAPAPRRGRGRGCHRTVPTSPGPSRPSPSCPQVPSALTHLTPRLQLRSVLPAPEVPFRRVTCTPPAPTSLWGTKTHANSGRPVGSNALHTGTSSYQGSMRFPLGPGPPSRCLHPVSSALTDTTHAWCGPLRAPRACSGTHPCKVNNCFCMHKAKATCRQGDQGVTSSRPLLACLQLTANWARPPPRSPLVSSQTAAVVITTLSVDSQHELLFPTGF